MERNAQPIGVFDSGVGGLTVVAKLRMLLEQYKYTYERKENTFCLQCRFDRKKQAQRHWCRVNAKRGERP